MDLTEIMINPSEIDSSELECIKQVLIEKKSIIIKDLSNEGQLLFWQGSFFQEHREECYYENYTKTQTRCYELRAKINKIDNFIDSIDEELEKRKEVTKVKSKKN